MVIQIDGLTKRYGSVIAIQDISFAVHTGEVVGFVGPNGAGKSTTMKILACLLPPSEGSASISGFDTISRSTDTRRSIGYLPESVPLYTDMTVKGYLDYMASLRDVTRSHRARGVREVIDVVDIAEHAERRIGTLSKGYRQRVGIAQAVVHQPPALVLDEPTNGLDPAQIIGMRSLIRRLGEDHAVLLSSHLLSEVALICDRLVVIAGGHLVAQGTLAELGAVAGLDETATAESIFMALTGKGEVEGW